MSKISQKGHVPEGSFLSEKKIIDRFDFLVVICLIVICFTPYWQIIHHGFSDFDDHLYVSENSQVQKGLTRESLKWAFSISHEEERLYWHPITWLSHMLDCELFGLNPNMHHLTTLVLHLSNTILLFILFRLMTGSIWKSAFISALFAIHPINVESVAWLSERKNVLSTTFAFSTLIAYFYYTAKKSILLYATVFLFLLLGLLTKPMLVTIPCLMLLFDVWPLNRLSASTEAPFLNIKTLKQLLIEKIPFFIITCVSIILTQYSLKSVNNIINTQTTSMTLRIANAWVSYIRYLSKILWPQNLTTFYPYPEVIPLWQSLGAFLLIFLVSILAFLWIQKRPYLFTGWFLFLGVLAPVSGIIQAGWWPAMADRWAYLPEIGIFIIITWGVSDLVRSLRHSQIVFTCGAAMILVILIICTWKQTALWSDDFKIWLYTVEHTSNNAKGHCYIGTKYLEMESYEKAIQHLRESVRINPNDYEAQSRLGVAYAQRENFPKAINHLSLAEKINPEDKITLENLGLVYMKQGKSEESIQSFKRVLSISPENIKALVNIGEGFIKIKRFTDAIPYYQKALQVNPKLHMAHYRLGSIFQKLNDIDSALLHYNRAVAIQPNFGMGYYQLGLVYLGQTQLEQAVKYLKKAKKFMPSYQKTADLLQKTESSLKTINAAISETIQKIDKKPNDSQSRLRLGHLYELKGENNRAIEQYEWIRSSEPANLQASNKLLNLYYHRKQYFKAINVLESQLSNAPENQELYFNMACLYALQKNSKKAVDYLKQAITKGYTNWKKIKTDKDLKNIRDTLSYKEFIQKSYEME